MIERMAPKKPPPPMIADPNRQGAADALQFLENWDSLTPEEKKALGAAPQPKAKPKGSKLN
jgi:hypothetical protein